MHRITQEIPRRARIFDYGPVTLFGAIFHSLHLIVALPDRAPTTPPASWWFGLFRFRSPLLTESLSISFPPVTEMFHFTGCRDVPAMYSQKLDQVLTRSGYPIRKSPGHSVFTALRGLSQLATSFIAYWHQGIHYVLFVA